MEESLITVKEVADYLKLKEQTVYLLARQNKIPSLKVGVCASRNLKLIHGFFRLRMLLVDRRGPSREPS